MPYPQKPTDLFVVNGWYLEMPGLTSPHFETLEGLQKNSTSVEIVDAGSNKKFKFPGQIEDFGELSLTRTHQGTPDDIALERMAEQMIKFGLKVNATAVKLHHGQPVFTVLLEGFRISSMTLPSFDVNTEEKFLVTYGASCDNWSILR